MFMCGIKMNKIRRGKKAYFFSIDALIAVVIIVSVILVARPIAKQKQLEMNLQEDTLEVLSSMKINEIENSYAQQLISDKKITNLNQSVLEQIGEFYAKEMPEAELLANDVLLQLSPKENIGIWFNNQLIASSNTTSFENAERIWTSRQIISGIEKGNNAKGYSSRAYLSKANRVKYFYFGGYIGDGNITAEIEYNGSIKDAEIEAAFGADFDVYINNNFISHYAVGNPLIPKKIYLSGYLDRFNSGKNYVEFRGNNVYVAGGYIKLVYESPDTFSLAKKHEFPGIKGVINIYDSFYIPGILNSMSIRLHYKSPYFMFVNIGNITVFNASSSNEIITDVPDSQLFSMLDYQALSKKTTPVRIGLYELEKLRENGNADVILITDLSGSMNSKLDSEDTGVARDCNDPHLYDSDTKRVSLAKCLDKMVVDAILNVSGNRLAMSAFYGDASSPFKGRVYQESLSNDSAYLKGRIDAYDVQGGTCICCSINDAYKMLNEESNSSRKRFVIVMSDGIPTHTCQAASGCAGTRTGLPGNEGLWLGYGAGCYGGADDCNVNDCQCASQNANWSSCRVYNELNATVYSIGFGSVATCSMANTTLNSIADCGRGKYYSSNNATLLQEIYSSISREILELSYVEQISKVIGAFNNTILYPDSYISFDYASEAVPYGAAITSQTQDFGNEVTEGALYIPQDSEIAEVNLVSYSGARWTDNVYVYNNSNLSWEKVFSLSDYGNSYGGLGDAYIVNIPAGRLAKGNNSFKITTGISPLNSSGGSSADKAIYTFVKQVSGYSKISLSAKGCKWHIEFEDSTNTTLNIPANYSGSEECYYTSQSIAYNSNDAIDNAIYSLLLSLDLNSNRRIETKFSEQDLNIGSVEVAGIPFVWESEVQARVWR